MTSTDRGKQDILLVRSDVGQCKDHPHAVSEFVLTPELQHWGKYICSECGRWLTWVTKPDNEKRNRRNSKKLAKPWVVYAGIDYCQICLRKKDELPPHMVFVGHHIVEVRDGGTDEPSNLLHLCTFCHELVHLIRRNAATCARPTESANWWELERSIPK